MSDQAALSWVEIEGFRGFNVRQRLDLDASAVIVAGSNGAGKTSFFDAVQQGFRRCEAHDHAE